MISRASLTLILLCVAAANCFAATCDSLRNLKLQDTTITAATEVAAGAFTPPDPQVAAVFKQLSAFCRVAADVKPTADSDIKMEVWLPLTGWNKRFVSNGNGGFAGSINPVAMARAVGQGFATASTDTGHESPDATDARWALGHPEKIVDFGWRGVHLMTVQAKAIVNAFYGNVPEHSYFASCSNGGRQGLMEAQRFPADYDGIIAGAPANYWTRLLSQAAYDMQATEAEPASYIPASKVTAIANAVLKSCDASDGVTDGVVNDPRMCHFDPNTMVCKAGDSDSCLTQSQATALKKIYDGPHSANGEAINPGFSPGGEGGGGGWSLWVTGPAPHESLQYKFASNFFAYMLTNDPQWTIKQFNLDRDFKSANAKMASALNATDPNLNTFQKRGGKLIVYHGWSDAAIPPLDAIKYFETVRSAMGSNVVNSFARLYMAPGVQHCAGGDGPDSFGQYEASGSDADPQHNMFAALEQWVEKGVAPGAIIATHDGEKKITRPLCPYPQQARYKGTGDTNDAANFSCTDRK